MKRFAVVSTLVLGLLAGGALFGDEPKTDKGAKDAAAPATPESKAKTKTARGLPPGFSKLGLTEDQKKKFAALRDEFNAKREVLQKQLAELREAEEEQFMKILTDEQKAEYKQLRASKILGTGESRKATAIKQ